MVEDCLTNRQRLHSKQGREVKSTTKKAATLKGCSLFCVYGGDAGT